LLCLNTYSTVSSPTTSISPFP